VRLKDSSAACGMQTKFKLSKVTQEAQVHQSRVQQLETEYGERFAQQERALKDVAAAMAREEQAKVTAQSQVRAAKERSTNLTGEANALRSKLSDAQEWCRDLKLERDDLQVRLQA
jgi:chromosome segregation ATPase